MEKRHLFERESQQEALQEFDALARIKELVDWEAFRPRFCNFRKCHTSICNVVVDSPCCFQSIAKVSSCSLLLDDFKESRVPFPPTIFYPFRDRFSF